MQIESPELFSLLLLVPLTIYFNRRRKTKASLRFSSLREIKKLRPSLRLRLRWLRPALRIACIVLLVLALARPREGTTIERISTKGVAMELVVDRSGSMQAVMNYRGREKTRLEVVKEVLEDFILGEEGMQGRRNDLLGMITFARYADTVCPLVHAHDALLGFLDQTDVVPDDSEENATNIGEAIARAAARLKVAEEEITSRNRKIRAAAEAAGEEAKPDFAIQSKAIVLLTDGRNTVPADQTTYTPGEAVKLAKDWGIKIYTIGIGGPDDYVIRQTPFGERKWPAGADLDEQLLCDIANYTGGFYQRATDPDSLRRIMEKIDELETTEIESIQYSRFEEKFGPWALAALIVLALEIVLSCTVFRKIP